jgi:hypothetical protein
MEKNKMRTKLFLLIVLFLTSCAVPTTPVPTSTLTFTPEPTATIQPTITPTPIPTATPTPVVVQYEISTLKKFSGLGEPVYEIPEDDPFNNKYLSWLDANKTPFSSEAKPIHMVSDDAQSWVRYDSTPEVKKLLSDPNKRPYHYGPIGHIILKSGEECLLLPFDILGDDGTHNWVVTSNVIVVPSGKYPFVFTANEIKYNVKKWKGYPPVFIFSTNVIGDRPGNDWLRSDPVYMSQILHPNWLELTRRFIDNNDSSISIPGMIFYTTIIIS